MELLEVVMVEFELHNRNHNRNRRHKRVLSIIG
jgi:hypothetical protein